MYKNSQDKYFWWPQWFTKHIYTNQLLTEYWNISAQDPGIAWGWIFLMRIHCSAMWIQPILVIILWDNIWLMSWEKIILVTIFAKIIFCWTQNLYPLKVNWSPLKCLQRLYSSSIFPDGCYTARWNDHRKTFHNL